MGALAGWIAAGRSAPEEGAIGPMLEALAHRGPGEGAMLRMKPGAVLGARGPQPLHDPAARIAVALDGEICNREALRAQLAVRGYRFSGDSSAEVLMRAYQHWDKDAVKQLRGAFAFAVWDARKDLLVLARDRFGEKPLYLAERGGALGFASEAKALLAGPLARAALDPQAMWDCLLYRYVPGPRTLFAGVRKLAPGSYAVWQFDRLREMRYWTPPDREARSPEPPAADAVAAFITQLDEATRLRMASGGATGVFLSGGFDSSALAALMARHGGRIASFSAGLEGAGGGAELARAARLARHLGAEHHEIVLSPRELAAELPRMVAARDAPVSRPSDLVLHALAREARRSVPTVLTGDGGDEVLGGYRRHAAEGWAWLTASLPTLLAAAAPLARRRPRLRAALDALGSRDWRERSVRWIGAQDRASRARLAMLEVDTAGLPEGCEADPRASRLRRMLYFEQSSWLPDQLLERADRMTMAAGLEARAPFLDHRVAEYVSALPDAMRVRGLTTKWLLREASRRLVPRQAAPRKAGIAVPAGEWLRGELRELVLDGLRGTGSFTRAYYDAAALDRLLDEHLAGRRNHEHVLWTLLNLEIWHRTYRPG